MDKKDSDVLDKVRQQFDTGPYPRKPLDKSPKEDVNFLYIHNLVTPYYQRNRKFIETANKVILDAGCGSGYKSLALAYANPGAKIIGIDFSKESVNLAKERLQYYGFSDAQFYTLAIEELPKLGIEFDYINCNDVLYFFPDPALGLQAMKSVLKPDGIIRANLHSSLQRIHYYRAQHLYKMMGLMDGNPQELEIGVLRGMMKALKDNVQLKVATWDSRFEESDEAILMNHLLQSDKGSTIPEMFSAIAAAGLEFISMVNWQKWELMDLFKEPDNLPVFLAMSLPETSLEERLHIYELLNPVHRLLDFWCGHPNQAQSFVPVEDWTLYDWQRAKVHLHPQLQTPAIKEGLLRCISELKLFDISGQLSLTQEHIWIDSTLAACLLPLWDEAQSMLSLISRWHKLRPVHPVTLEPIAFWEALEIVSSTLTGLERYGYVLLELQP